MRSNLVRRLIRCLAFVATGFTGADLTALAEDLEDMPEPALARAVEAGESGPSPPDQANRLLLRLAGARGSQHGEGVSRVLRMLIDGLGPFDRTILVAEWALDDDAGVRLALALAMGEPIRAVSAPLAVEHLLRDPSHPVRLAAARAAARLAS